MADGNNVVIVACGVPVVSGLADTISDFKSDMVFDSVDSRCAPDVRRMDFTVNRWRLGASGVG